MSFSFNHLSSREKNLITAALALLMVALIWQFALKPALAYREAADLRQQRAAQTLSHMRQIESLSHQGHTIPLSVTTDTIKDNIGTIQNISQKLGIQISESRSLETGKHLFILDEVSAPLLFQWITAVESEVGMMVSSATITKSESSGVKAKITFSYQEQP